MKTITISKNYNFIWQLDFAPNYQFTKCKKLFNLKTSREIKKTLTSMTIGYYIKGKFYSLNKLRNHIVKIEKTICPF
jgi:hypothetical protein